jgi:dTDP-4-dehydrorhamnose 3,5-epimerase
MEINGLYIEKNAVHRDLRGDFSRIFDKHSISKNFDVLQANLSINPNARTLRGMHYQSSGKAENKYIKLLSGRIYLAVVDLREKESTHMNIFQREFEYEEQVSIHIPAGCATGWITLVDDTNLIYLMSARYEESKYNGFRFDDKIVQINWPVLPHYISEQDKQWLPFQQK